MITCIRSINELLFISNSREKIKSVSEQEALNESTENIYHYKNDINTNKKNLIDLPSFPRIKRRKWVKRKEAISRFFDELEYNNQIQPSYDLTLLEKQETYHQKDAA